MAEIGDTRLYINPATGLNISSPAPANGAIDVEFDLVEVSGLIRVDEYYDSGFGVGWYAIPGDKITGIGVLSIAMSGGISMDTPTGEIFPSPTNYIATITSASAEAFAGETEYTWSFDSITLTHDTDTFGSVTRTYATDEVSFTTGIIPRQINLTSPTDEDTGILLQPLLQWTIAGAGAQDGDLLDIYIKKDDSDFSADDLIGDLVDAALNSDKQIIAGLEYDATYYWQVQAANSAEGYSILLSSVIYSFTVQSFSPPAYSTRTVGEDTFPTGANNMLTIQRLIAAANGKIWYEVIEDI